MSNEKPEYIYLAIYEGGDDGMDDPSPHWTLEGAIKAFEEDEDEEEYGSQDDSDDDYPRHEWVKYREIDVWHCDFYEDWIIQKLKIRD